MNFKKTLLATSVVAAFGAGVLAADAAFADLVNAGSYNLVILPTPTKTTTSSQFNFGTDGAWNSSFVFGIGYFDDSAGMTDNGVNLTDADGPGTASRAFGSSIGGDGYAGKLGITISVFGAVTVTSFAKDTILGAYGEGEFAQEGGDLTAYSGSVNLATGAMTLVTGNFATGAGRRGATDAEDPANGCGGGSYVNPYYCDRIWNKDDIGGSQEYATFRTDSASTDTTTINGAALTSIGDVNADGLTDYQAVLVSGGDFGTAWGILAGNDYVEIWSVNLLSVTSTVPVPAAVWLFGSGLLGLVGVARRKAR